MLSVKNIGIKISNSHPFYIVCLIILLSLSACKTSVRNPSNAGIDPSLKALPANVFGEVLMEYYSAEAENESVSIYKTRESVLFKFDVDGSLSSTDQEILIDDDFEIRDREFIWVDEDNNFEYALSLTNGEISRLKVLSVGGDLFYGVFNLPSSGSEANGNSSTINDQNSNLEESLPENATGRHIMKFVGANEEMLFGANNEVLYINDQEVAFTLFSYGVIVLQGKEIKNMVVRGSEYIWTDTENGIQYLLLLDDDDEIDKFNVYDLSGEVLLGRFDWVSREYEPDQI